MNYVQNITKNRLCWHIYFNNVEQYIMNLFRIFLLSYCPSFIINVNYIHKNKTQYNNKYIKQRLKFIPIIIPELFKNRISQFTLKIDKTNLENKNQVVTLKDFTLYELKNDILTLSTLNIFPDEFTSIPIVDLFGYFEKKGESSIQLECNIQKGIGKTDISFCPVSVVSLSNKKSMMIEFLHKKNHKQIITEMFISIHNNIDNFCNDIKLTNLDEKKSIIELSFNDSIYPITYSISKHLYQDLCISKKQFSFIGYKQSHPLENISIIRFYPKKQIEIKKIIIKSIQEFKLKIQSIMDDILSFE